MHLCVGSFERANTHWQLLWETPKYLRCHLGLHHLNTVNLVDHILTMSVWLLVCQAHTCTVSSLAVLEVQSEQLQRNIILDFKHYPMSCKDMLSG